MRDNRHLAVRLWEHHCSQKLVDVKLDESVWRGWYEDDASRSKVSRMLRLHPTKSETKTRAAKHLRRNSILSRRRVPSWALPRPRKRLQCTCPIGYSGKRRGEHEAACRIVWQACGIQTCFHEDRVGCVLHFLPDGVRVGSRSEEFRPVLLPRKRTTVQAMLLH